MASKQISITMDQWIYDAYLQGYNGNVSSFIIEHFVKGINLETGKYKFNENQNIKLMQDLKIVNEELRKSKLQIDNLKAKLQARIKDIIHEDWIDCDYCKNKVDPQFVKKLFKKNLCKSCSLDTEILSQLDYENRNKEVKE